jgi:hypothetical protein
LATGDSLKTISFSYRLGHSTVYTIVIDTCKAIINKLMTEVMPMPTEKKWKEIADKFWTYWNFPNVIGALDGKHIVTQALPNSGSLYFNYKKTFSIVLLALVDAHYNFITVDVGAYGKNSDGGILMHSKLGKMLETNTLNIPPNSILPGTNCSAPFVILGDEAFPLKNYLLRPYPGKQLDNENKRIYNYRHCRTRRVVENAFGLLTQKFRIFNGRIQANPENADIIVLASCVLHNFIKISDSNFSYNRNVTECTQLNETTTSTLNNIPFQGGNASQQAFNVRELFTDFFNSPDGAVSWQHNYI